MLPLETLDRREKKRVTRSEGEVRSELTCAVAVRNKYEVSEYIQCVLTTCRSNNALIDGDNSLVLLLFGGSVCLNCPSSVVYAVVF